MCSLIFLVLSAILLRQGAVEAASITPSPLTSGTQCVIVREGPSKGNNQYTLALGDCEKAVNFQYHGKDRFFFFPYFDSNRRLPGFNLLSFVRTETPSCMEVIEYYALLRDYYH